MPPDQVLRPRLETARELSRRHAACFSDVGAAGPGRRGHRDPALEGAFRRGARALHQLFRDRIYPVLTPLVVDPAHPFPYISGLSLSLAVMIADPRTGRTMFARVKVPPLLPRFLTVAQYRFVPMEDVIAAHLQELFKGLDVIEHHVFRVTRARDLEIDEDVTEDLLKSLERELMRRRVRARGPAGGRGADVQRHAGEAGGGAEHRRPSRVPPARPARPVWAERHRRSRPAGAEVPGLRPAETALPRDTGIFAALAERDVLVHHPTTRSPPPCSAWSCRRPPIRGCWRSSRRCTAPAADSPIVDALIDAAEAGKQVVVVVELKARFDERANITWAASWRKRAAMSSTASSA